MRMQVMWMAVLALWQGSTVAGGELTVSPLFSDNMVLQRERAVPVWGMAAPGAEVRVTFAGQTKTATADAKGAWKTSLDPLQADKTPAEMVISSGAKSVVVKDVLVGEVWICSGQSNMNQTMATLKQQNGKDTPLVKEIEAANFPAIRQFQVRSQTSPEHPQGVFSGRWIPCSPQSVDAFTGVGFFFARELHAKLGVPIGLIKSSVGGTPIESWMSKEMLQTSEYGKKVIADWQAYDSDKAAAEYKTALAKWETLKKEAEAAGKPAPEKPSEQRAPFNPAILYDTMIHPLIPFAIRGVVWYQGESNVGVPRAYYETFPALINGWRTAWGQGDFPFYFVQLANYMEVKNQPSGSGFAVVRDAQLKALSLPNTGMAVAIDIGEEKDVHPRNKIDVGVRLALWARAKEYKQDVKVYSGPLFKSAQFMEGKVVLTFDSVGGGLVAGKRPDVWTAPELNSDPPERFQLCGADKKWVWGKAKITATDTVEVTSDVVKKPIAARYIWMDNPGPVPLLYNKEGLPAATFRTDNF